MMLSTVYKVYLISFSKSIAKFLENIWVLELWKFLPMFWIEAQCMEIILPDSVDEI